MGRAFDPITLEILWRRLISIVDEADSSVARTAFSSLLRDAHDYTCMFTDRKGRELAQGSFATPGQSGAMAIGVKNLVTSLPSDHYQPGDVFITNDPWALAGHLNDVCVWSPIFYKERLVAFTACVFHHSDIGGRVSSDNHDVFEEGLFIPLVKLYDKGVLNQSVLDMIRWNVRTPDEVVGDIRSLSAQMPDGTVEIDRVPVNNGGGDEAQARCAEALVFEGAVSNFPLTVKEYRAAQRVAGLALVETGMTALAQRRIG